MTWEWATLGEVLDVSIGGVWGRRPGEDEVDVRVWRVTELKPGGRLDPGTAAHRSVTAKQLSSRSLKPGDLLLEKSGGGPRTPVGRVGLVRFVDEPSVCANFMQLMRPDTTRVDPRFLHLYLNHFHDSGGTEAIQTASTNIRNIKSSEYVKINVPVPPLEEQRRIVAILEDHLSRLDAAEASLEDSLRRLTSLEQSALARCRDGDDMPLPEIAEIQGGIQKQQKRTPKSNAFPFLRVANVTARGLDLTEVHKVELFGNELDRLRLEKGDLLVVEGNGSASQIGRAAIWDGSIEDCVHQNHLIRVRPNVSMLPEYLEAVWNSPQNRQMLSDISSSSSGLHTLSVSKLKQLSIPLPRLHVQQQLVCQVSEIRDYRKRLDTSLKLAKGRSTALRRSLLAAAFSGRLTGSRTEMSVV